MVGRLRRARVLCRGRIRGVKRYLEECRHSMEPMPNPPGYKEEPPVNYLRHTPQQHAEIWKRGWQNYKATFQQSWGLDSKEEKKKKEEEGEGKQEEEQGVALPEEIKPYIDKIKTYLPDKAEVEAEVRDLESRMKYELTPEEEKLHRRQLATDLMDGYREGREASTQDVEEVVNKQMESIKGLFASDLEFTPEAIEANKRRNLAMIKEAIQGKLLTDEERRAVDREAEELMKHFDRAPDMEEVRAVQAQVDELMERVRRGVAGAVQGAKKGVFSTAAAGSSGRSSTDGSSQSGSGGGDGSHDSSSSKAPPSSSSSSSSGPAS